MADATDVVEDASIPTAEVPADTTVYCLCDNIGGSGFMIECSDGSGGCNGWFHPQCCGLELTKEVIDKITEYSFTCSLCIAKQVAEKNQKKKAKVKPPKVPKADGDKKASKASKKGDKVKTDKKKGGKRANNEVTGKEKASSSTKRAKVVGKSGLASKTLSRVNRKDGGGGDDSFADEAAIRAALRPERNASSKDQEEGTLDESIMVVDKILGRKLAPPPEPWIEEEDKFDEEGNKIMPPPPSTKPVEWFLIKWRNFSYLHASWEVASDIEAVDLQGRVKLRRFLATEPKLFDETTKDGAEELKELEFIDPEFLEVQTILNCDTVNPKHADAFGLKKTKTKQSKKIKSKNKSSNASSVSSPSSSSEPIAAAAAAELEEEEDNKWWVEADEAEDSVKYLVKWRGLTYSDATWEDFATIKHEANTLIKRFWVRERSPPTLESEKRNMPPELKLYKTLKSSPLFGLYPDKDGNMPDVFPEVPPSPIKTMPDPTPVSTEVSTGVSNEVSNEVSTEVSNENAMQDDVSTALVPSDPSPSDAVASDAVPMEVEEMPSADTVTADPIASTTEEVPAVDEEVPAVNVTGLNLRDYQLEGVNWLYWNWFNQRPSILADEMGLGKTIQTIGYFHRLRHSPETKLRGPFIIVAPLSLVYQWQNEAAVWAPDMNVIVYHGSGESRSVMQEHEFWYRDPHVPKDQAVAFKKEMVTKFDVMVTTFEVAIKDISVLSKIPWRVLVVDEAHRLKNPEARLFQQLQMLRREHCILLTGTPLQNRTEELWALLHFASPEKFPYLDQFVEKFGDLKVSSQVAQLHSLLKPYLLRRVKEDVEKSLPPKEETIIEVSLTAVQKQFYRAIYERNTDSLFKDVKASSAPCLMNVMMELRKCCNHPYLNRGVEELIIEQIPSEKQTRTNLHMQMVNSSGKMVLLDKLLPRLAEQGHKVLIFSQMVRVLDLLEDYIRHKGYLYERLDGSSRSSDRSAGVARFNRPSCKRFIMLLSTRAGGLGLNLTSADTVIIFDSDWNPHNDIQAQARAHRIGQTKAVMVYRLITTKTYEMHMFHKASMKLGLDKAVLAHAKNEAEKEANEGASEDLTSSSQAPEEKSAMDLHAKEIDELLKRGAYDVFREDDADVKAFVEADIDSILERSVKKVTYAGAGNEEGAVEGGAVKAPGSTFSKASFVGMGGDEDIDLDDPDFWKKAVGLNQPAGFVEENNEEGLEGEGTGGLVLSAANRKKRKKKASKEEQAAIALAEKEASNVLTTSEEIAKQLVAAAAEEMLVPVVKPPTPEPEPEPEPIVEEPSEMVDQDVSKSENGKEGENKDSNVASKDIKETKPKKKKGRREKTEEEKLAETTARESAAVSKGTRGGRDRRPPKPPKDWGPHNRDRLIRALMLFGFGRWDRLRRESGATNRVLGDVENVSRAYIYICGLAAGQANVDGEHVHLGVGSGNGGTNKKRVRNATSPEKPLSTPSTSATLPVVASSSSSNDTQMFQELSRKFLEDQVRKAEGDGGMSMSEGGVTVPMFANLQGLQGVDLVDQGSSLTLDPISFNGMENTLKLDQQTITEDLGLGAPMDMNESMDGMNKSMDSIENGLTPLENYDNLLSLGTSVNGTPTAKGVTSPRQGKGDDSIGEAMAEANALARTKFILTTAITRETSPWVKECMETSVKIDELRSREATKRIKVHVPNILLDHKFLAKLRAGGARKALLRLELLTKLHQMVATSREGAFKRLDTAARVSSGLKKDGTLEVNPSDYISPLYSDEAHTLKRRKGGLLRHINKQRQRLGLTPLLDIEPNTSNTSLTVAAPLSRSASASDVTSPKTDAQEDVTNSGEADVAVKADDGSLLDESGMPPPPVVDAKVMAEKLLNEKLAQEKAVAEKVATAEKKANRSSWYGQPGVMGVDLSLVCEELPLNKNLPHWTRLAPWWDSVADSHLVLGTYRHGYGKYDMMVADPELCFGRRLDEFSVYHADALRITGDDSTTVSNDGGSQPSEASTAAAALKKAMSDQPPRAQVVNPPMVFELSDLNSLESIKDDEDSMEDGLPEAASADSLVRVVTLPGWKPSNYRGVYGQPGSTRWLAQLGGDPQHSRFLGYNGTFLGSFETEEGAARAYDAESRKHFGESVAICNFNEDGTRCQPPPPLEEFVPGTFIPSLNAFESMNESTSEDQSSSGHVTSIAAAPIAMIGGNLERSTSENVSSKKSSASNNDNDDDGSGDKPAPPLFSASTTITSPAVYALSWRRPSPYRGVCAAGCKWEASYDFKRYDHIYLNKSSNEETNEEANNESDWQYLGTFETELEACIAHDEAEYNMYSAALAYTKSGGTAVTGVGGGIRRNKKGSSAGSKASRPAANLPPLAPPSPPKLNFPPNDPVKNLNAVLSRLAERGALSVEWMTAEEAKKVIKPQEEATPPSTSDVLLPVDSDFNSVTGVGQVGATIGQVVEDLAMPDARVLNRLLTWLVISPLARVEESAIQQVRCLELKEIEAKYDISPSILVPYSNTTQVPEQIGVYDSIVDRHGRSQLDAEIETFRILNQALPFELRKNNMMNTNEIIDFLQNKCKSVDVNVFDVWRNDEVVTASSSTDLELVGEDETSKSPWIADVKTCARKMALESIAGETDEAQIKSVQSWITHQKSRHCIFYQLLKHGAPPSDWEMNIAKLNKGGELSVDAEVEALMRLSSSAVEGEGSYDLSYSWQDVVTSLLDSEGRDEYMLNERTLNIQDLSWYYLNCLLPLCAALVSVPFEQMVANQSTTSNQTNGQKMETLSDLPDPTRPLNQHSIVARRIAFSFLRRQQILISCRYMLSRKASLLLAHLRTPIGRNVMGCPIWWCPWVHDVALFVASNKKGLPTSEYLRNDLNRYPTSKTNVIKHVQKVFFENGGKNVSNGTSITQHGFGNASTLIPAASGVFSTQSQANEWFEDISQTFPTYNEIELRIEQACISLSHDLFPYGHPLRIRECCFSHRPNEMKYENVIRKIPIALPALMLESKARRDAYLNRRALSNAAIV